MLQYSVNICVFSRLLKLSLPRSGSFKLSGREFQSDGPATEKARGPSVLSRHRGTTKKRRVADRRCCHAETSDNGTQRRVTSPGFAPPYSYYQHPNPANMVHKSLENAEQPKAVGYTIADKSIRDSLAISHPP